MKWIKTTALASLLFASLLVISSCEKEAETKKVNIYSKTGILLTGAQLAPSSVVSASTALGSVDVTYDRGSKMLTYKITWSGLSDSVIAIRICGPAPVGFPSLNPAFTGANPYAVATTPYNVFQEITYNMVNNLLSASAAVQAATANKTVFPSTGSYSGSLEVDNVQVKEQDLLNHYYYITIHTGKTYPPTPTAPSPLPTALQQQYRWWGEIRAQIKFQ